MRNFLEYFIDLSGIEYVSKDYTEVITSSYSATKYGEIGKKVSDLLVLQSGDFNKGKGLFKKSLIDFSETVDMYEAAITFRKILWDTRFEGCESASLLLIIWNLVMEAYSCQSLVGVDSVNRKCILGSNVSPYRVGLMISLILTERHKNSVKNILHMSNKTISKVRTWITRSSLSGLFAELLSLSSEDLLLMFNNLRVSLQYTYTSLIFNELTTDFYNLVNPISHWRWEREETVFSTLTIINTFRSIYSSDFNRDDLLKVRKFYVRDKGVRIRFIDPPDDITSIAIREFHSEDEHLLNVYYETGDGLIRFIPIDILSLDRSNAFLQYEKDFSAVFLVFSWLGLSKKVNLEKHKSKELVDHLLSVLKEYDEITKDSNIVYETPVNWNYNNLQSNSPSVKTRAVVMEKRHIGRYTRKLPSGHKPSSEAITLAKKVMIELEEGYTLVDEFDRIQKKRL